MRVGSVSNRVSSTLVGVEHRQSCRAPCRAADPYAATPRSFPKRHIDFGPLESHDTEHDRSSKIERGPQVPDDNLADLLERLDVLADNGYGRATFYGKALGRRNEELHLASPKGILAIRFLSSNACLLWGSVWGTIGSGSVLTGLIRCDIWSRLTIAVNATIRSGV